MFNAEEILAAADRAMSESVGTLKTITHRDVYRELGYNGDRTVVTGTLIRNTLIRAGYVVVGKGKKARYVFKGGGLS